MSVQINEVIIRAIVEPEECDAQDRGNNDSSLPGADDSRGALLERLLEIIQESRER